VEKWCDQMIWLNEYQMVMTIKLLKYDNSIHDNNVCIDFVTAFELQYNEINKN